MASTKKKPAKAGKHAPKRPAPKKSKAPARKAAPAKKKAAPPRKPAKPAPARKKVAKAPAKARPIAKPKPVVKKKVVKPATAGRPAPKAAPKPAPTKAAPAARPTTTTKPVNTPVKIPVKGAVAKPAAPAKAASEAKAPAPAPAPAPKKAAAPKAPKVEVPKAPLVMTNVDPLSGPVRTLKRAMKERFVVEYYVHSSPYSLYEAISTPSGLSKWFSDDVNVRGEEFTFVWGNDQQTAEVLSRKQGELIRLHWKDDDDEGAYFELRIRIDPMTNEVALVITDHAWPNELAEARLLWESQLHTLQRVLGA